MQTLDQPLTTTRPRLPIIDEAILSMQEPNRFERGEALFVVARQPMRTCHGLRDRLEVIPATVHEVDASGWLYTLRIDLNGWPRLSAGNHQSDLMKLDAVQNAAEI